MLAYTASLAYLRFTTFWPQYHDYLLGVVQFPLFSPIPFAEKVTVSLLKVCIKFFSSYQPDRHPEELIFKSINLMWKLDKEIIDNCCELLAQSVSKIITDYVRNLQTQFGWKSILYLSSLTVRRGEATAEQGQARRWWGWHRRNLV
ncbi:hypothetical protein U1Q18_028335 [Sarracenia purpurea var. burkii]